jgi:hypothetical protein
MKQREGEQIVENSKSLASLAVAVERADGPEFPLAPDFRADIPVLRWAASGISLAEFLANDRGAGMSD